MMKKERYFFRKGKQKENIIETRVNHGHTLVWPWVNRRLFQEKHGENLGKGGEDFLDTFSPNHGVGAR